MGMKENGYTDLGGTGAVFLTTHWSLVEQAGSDEALVGSLLEKYWKPVYCYLRRQGYHNEDAKDLTQGFFQDIVLGHDLIGKADQSKGRFRSYLLMALDRYLINVRQKETAQRRIPKDRLAALDALEVSELPAAISEASPEESFNYAWVSTLLEEVLQQLESQCQSDGTSTHWYLFRERVLLPILDGASPCSLSQLCARYGVEDTTKASNMIVTVKRRFRTILQKRLRSLVTSDEQVREEWEEIRRFFPAVAQDQEDLR